MKKGIIIVLIAVITFIIGIYVGRYVIPTNTETKKEEQEETRKIENVRIEKIDGKEFYVMTGTYTGDYDYQSINLAKYYSSDEARQKIENYNKTEIMDYDKYVAFCKEWELKQKYNSTEYNYMIISYSSYGQPIVNAKIANVLFDADTVNVYLWEEVRGVTADIGGYFIAIPINKTITEKNVYMVLTEEEFTRLKNGERGPYEYSVDKPVIYIYPERDTIVNVELGYPELLTVTYPKYNNGWKYLATKNGDLIDLNTGRKYYALYWEGKKDNLMMKQDGFIVKGSDTISFLEEKLSILGLNEREANEFIMYWLPKLEGNKYNYIRFETEEEINTYMSLTVSPQPETVIRVIMDYKALDSEISIKEQKLNPKTRKGYTVVEWGGSQIR